MRCMRSLHARRSLFPLALAAAFGSLAGCDRSLAGDHQLTSLRMTLKSPDAGSLGTPGKSVSPTSLRFAAEALDEQGRIFPANATVEAFLVAGGTRVPLVN